MELIELIKYKKKIIQYIKKKLNDDRSRYRKLKITFNLRNIYINKKIFQSCKKEIKIKFYRIYKFFIS